MTWWWQWKRRALEAEAAAARLREVLGEQEETLRARNNELADARARVVVLTLQVRRMSER